MGFKDKEDTEGFSFFYDTLTVSLILNVTKKKVKILLE